MSKSNYLKEKLMDLALGATAWSVPATLYARLYTAAPNLSGTGGTEVDVAEWTDYAAKAITNNKTNWSAAATVSDITILSNALEIDFGSPTVVVASIPVVAVALWDAATSGNMLYATTLTLPKSIYNGQQVVFNAGTMVFREKECS